jgi:hypothetical protein
MLPPIHKLSSGSRVVFAHSSRRAHRLQTDVFVAALMREELETLEILPTTSEEKKKKKRSFRLKQTLQQQKDEKSFSHKTSVV